MVLHHRPRRHHARLRLSRRISLPRRLRRSYLVSRPHTHTHPPKPQHTHQEIVHRNPPNLVQKWLDTSYTPKSRAASFFAGVGLVICQLAINTIDNAFSAGMDLAGLFPNFINIRRGAYIGLILSIAMCPWQLLSAASTFISVLSAYSVFLGPMV